MIVTHEADLARRAKHLTTQARLPGPEYIHDDIGYNYRLTNLQAALGLAQLEQLPHFLEHKRRIAARYDEAFRGLERTIRPKLVPWGASSHWMYSMLIDPVKFGYNRPEVLKYLEEHSIQARPLWKPIHTLPMYKPYPRAGGEVAERLFAQGLSLPCSVGLSDEEQSDVIESVRTMANSQSSKDITAHCRERLLDQS